ncbi:sensor histidine kinase [Streptomyces marispadix]|uniref:histidine kinase n=1 Tax=Streptomyces marispadix TaxID=2922868 RepID=A0ABS9SUA2_9ACTN|nr:histidine kinase [Streptomyces marispadix]MCH6159855.1 histidine kinase [Streptomyces marispadix]
MRAHPYAVDALIALGVFVAILVGAAAESSPGQEVSPRFGRRDVAPATALLAALACGVLVLRRRAPMPVLCITGLVTVVGLIVDPGTGASGGHRAPIVISAIIALYTVSNRTDRVTSVRVGVLTVVVLTAAGMLLGTRPWYAQDNLATFAWTGLAAAAGEAVRNRRAFVDAMRERAERAERTREEEARRRVAEERMRIARELHDVVAHHIALVNVQAGVASHVMDQRPDQAKEALAHVREASRHALNELQATVGLLRQSGESVAPTEPAPGLGVLDELVEGFTRAGLSVSVDVTSEGAGDVRDAREGGGTPPGGARTPEGARTSEDARTPGDAHTTAEARTPGDTCTTGNAEAQRALPSAVDLTAYRVVQEALTNVQKHVGAGAHAEVRIVTRRDALEITVTDDGEGAADDPATQAETGGGAGRGNAPGTGATGSTAAAAPHGPAPAPTPAPPQPQPPAPVRESGSAREPAPEQGGGHGLIGMRERAVALHGECETGPLPGGGFRVHVRLPIQQPRAAETGPTGFRAEEGASA